MNIRNVAAAALVAYALFATHRISAQANINEYEPASLYVDASAGSDSNPGTQSQPFKTITAAANQANKNNASGIGTKVWINPGVYRESVFMYGGSHVTSAPITFQAVTIGTAVIDGADVVTGWAQSGSNSSIYTHSWTFNEGTCSLPSGWPGVQPIVLQREMVFVNGTPLTQVLSPSQMQTGTFYLNTSTKQMSIWPASGTSVNTATVEVANRPVTFQIDNRSNIVVRGVVLQHGTACTNQASASAYASSNILFDKIQALWNSWGGLGFNRTSNYTVQNSVASHNGAVGFSGYENKNALYQYDESDDNNWRGAMGGFYDWAMGGTKLMHMHGVTVNQLYALNNKAQGLWFDTDNKDITISNSVLSGNTMANLQLEADQGPITVKGTALCSGGTGVMMLNSTYVTLNGNTLYNNGNAHLYRGQIWAAGQAGGRSVTDWETGQTYSLVVSHTTLSGNVVQDASPSQFLFSTYLNPGDWGKFSSTFSSNNNTWYDGSQAAAFGAQNNGDHFDLSGWRRTTGQDWSSSWSQSSTAPTACNVNSR